MDKIVEDKAWGLKVRSYKSKITVWGINKQA